MCFSQFERLLRSDIVNEAHGWGTVPANGSAGLLVQTSLLSALQTRAERSEGLTLPFDFWLIDGVKVAEPHSQVESLVPQRTSH